MAILLGNKPVNWPRPITPTYGWWKAANGDAGVYYPGFSNDTSTGSSIQISGSYNNVTFIYSNNAGVKITDGAWGTGAGLVRENFAGGSAVRMSRWWMDSADALLYFILIKFDQTQKQLALASINKLGVIVQKPWRNVSAADGNGEVGHMERAGGDGSGNFTLVANGPTGASATRGKLFTFAVSDGALTTSDLVPANAYDTAYTYNFNTHMGPTPNGIYTRLYGSINTYATGQAPWCQGGIWNTTTGRGKFEMMYPQAPWGPVVSATSNYMTMEQSFGWRGYQTFKLGSGYNTVNLYDRTEMFTFMDAMAREVGIL